MLNRRTRTIASDVWVLTYYVYQLMLGALDGAARDTRSISCAPTTALLDDATRMPFYESLLWPLFASRGQMTQHSLDA